MLAGRIPSKDRIELVDVEEPELDEETGGDIIFQPTLACLCGSDIPFFSEEQDSYPLPPGYSLHEMIGTVKAASGKRFQPGDRVLAVPVGQRGLFERFRVREDRAISLDARPLPEHALMAQPLGTVLFALRKLPPVVGLDVAVVGQGPIGQLFCAALRNLGAREIIALDVLDARLEGAARMGATATVRVKEEDPLKKVSRITAGRMADLVVEAIGHCEQDLNACIDLCRQGGRILSFGVPPRTIDGIRWNDLFFKNITVHTSVNPDFRVDFPLAMKWIAEERIDVSPLVTHRYPLSRLQTAFETYRDRRDGVLKVLLEFPAV